MLVGLAILVAGCLMLTWADSASADAKFLYVKSNAANIRNIPSIQGEILTTVQFGARLYSMEHLDDWYQVKLDDGRIGFVYDELVKRWQEN